MEYVAHDNDKVNDVWGIPSDLTQVLVVTVLLVLYRTRFKPEPAAQPLLRSTGCLSER